MIANISGIFELGYFSFSPDVVCIQTPLVVGKVGMAAKKKLNKNRR